MTDEEKLLEEWIRLDKEIAELEKDLAANSTRLALLIGGIVITLAYILCF